jgi:hypothetical protein
MRQEDEPHLPRNSNEPHRCRWRSGFDLRAEELVMR